jgi:predicted secreted protein
VTAKLSWALVALAAVLWIAQLFIAGGGVNFVTGIVVYLIVWWMVFFCVLPLRVQSQQEMGDIEPGSDPGAPADPQLKYKAKLTSAIAAGIWLVYFVVFEFGLLSLEMFPIGPTLTPVQ